MDGFVVHVLAGDQGATAGPPAFSRETGAAFDGGLPVARMRGCERDGTLLRELCVFGLDAPPAVEAITPSPPTYGAEELAAAQEAAFAQGRAAALAEAATAIDAATAAALTTLAAALRDAGSEAGRLTEAAAEEVGRLLIAVLGACLPATAQRLAEAEAAALAAEILPALPSEPRIVVQIAPALATGLAARLASLAPELTARIVVEPTPSLAPADVRFAWSAGSARRAVSDVWASVVGILGPLGLSIPGLTASDCAPSAFGGPHQPAEERCTMLPIHDGDDEP